MNDPDIIRMCEEGFSDTVARPEYFKYLLQMNWETRRFKPLN